MFLNSSKKPVKVHLYKIRTEKGSTPLLALIEAFGGASIEERERKLGNEPYRLEEALPPSATCPYWLLDFTRLRFDGGPGKASTATPVESFELGGGYGFAEETAVLMDLDHGWAAVQYNHFGPRANAIAEYLSMLDPEKPNTYELLLQLNTTAQARLAKKKFFSRLKIRVAPTKLSPEFKKSNLSLVAALEAQTNEFGGDFVALEVSLERDSPKSLKLSKWIPSFLKMANEEHEAVEALVVSGRDDAGMSIDPVDLIKERLEFSIKGLPLDEGLRYPRNARYDALQRAMNGWKAQGVIG